MSRLFFILMACLPLVAQETLDRVLVVVDQETILESEVGQELQRYLMERKLDAQTMGEELETIKFDLVQGMIDSKVLYAVARADTNIVITDKEIERRAQDRLDEILRQVGSERRLEEAMGQPVKEIKRSLLSGMRERTMVEEAQRRKLGNVKVTRQEIEEFYEAYLDSLPQVGESVRLSHIFMPWKPSVASEQRARFLADSLRAVLAKDSSLFAELAATFSQDPGSAVAGGAIGRTKRGSLVRPYEEAAYRLNEGEITAPVRSEYGWHIIRLDGRQGEYIESSHILIKLEPTAEDRQLIYDQADSIYAALAGGAEFAAMAKRYSDHAISRENGGDLGWLSMDQLQPLVRSRVRELKPGEISRPTRGEVEGREGMQILMLKEHRDARRPDKEADWNQLETMALNMKKQRLLQEWIKDLREQVYIQVVD